MFSPQTNIAAKSRARQPRIVLNAEDLPRIEALAEGAIVRNPALADRMFDEINRAQIVPASEMPGDVIGIGSTATYRDETTGQEKAFTLVYPEDANIALDRVSVLTPIGVALLGLAEGAAFHWDTRANQRRTLTVIRVEQPAGSGES
ncbi:nucleoside diphosphate kinase regulator [Roseovarius sp. S1116L3]|uniref:nucleoside diphosphate kinase regulator n=1 Tax=Roseovarius roseus TaxID=3342636 RepID=UPI00372CE461